MVKSQSGILGSNGIIHSFLSLLVSMNYMKGLVDLEGFEPSTSSMPWRRAPNCATGPHSLVFFLTYHTPDEQHSALLGNGSGVS